MCFVYLFLMTNILENMDWMQAETQWCHLVMIWKKCEAQLYYIALLKHRCKRIFMQQAYFIQLLTNSHTVMCTVKIPYFPGLITSLFEESFFNFRDNLADSWKSGQTWQSNDHKKFFSSWEYIFGWSELVRILQDSDIWIMCKWPCYVEEKGTIKSIFSV